MGLISDIHLTENAIALGKVGWKPAMAGNITGREAAGEAVRSFQRKIDPLSMVALSGFSVGADGVRVISRIAEVIYRDWEPSAA